MQMKPTTKGSIARIRSDIHQMTSLGQLLDYIPTVILSKIAYFAAMIWLLSPVLVMVSNLFQPGLDDWQQYFRHVMMAGLWFIILKITGTLGLLSGLMSAAKGFRKIYLSKTRLWTVVQDHMVAVFLLLFLIWSLLSAMLSPNPDIAFSGTIYRREGWFTYLFYAGLFCCGYQLRNLIQIRKLLATLCGTASFLSLLSILHMPWMKIWLGIEPAMSVFHNSNHYAYFLCMAILASLTGYLVNAKSKTAALLYLISFSLTSSALILNQSFGPYLAVIFGLLMVLVLTMLYKRDLMRMVVLATSIFVVLSLLLNQVSQHLLQDLWLTLTGIRQITSGDELAGSAGSGRWRLWVAAFQFMLERPLFGFGPDNLGQAYLDLGIEIDRPHNEILQFAASLGIPAALLYGMAVLIHLRDWFWQRRQVTVLALGLIGLLLAYWFSSMFGNTMYYTSPFFVLIWGLSAGQIKQNMMSHN